MLRAGFFIDGFNLYHSIDDMGANYLKWADLWRLGEEIIPSQSQSLVMVEFCTAYFPGDHGKRIRHDAYKNSLELRGVKCHWGHYATDDRECPSCDHKWQRPTEKQTDINVALSVFDAARRDMIDHAYLLSADSDQAATVKWFKSAFPEKSITIVIPPERPGSKQIRDKAAERSRIRLNRNHFERCHFGPVVTNGIKTINRPREYDPPEGWVHPDDMPKIKPKIPAGTKWKTAAKG